MPSWAKFVLIAALIVLVGSIFLIRSKQKKAGKKPWNIFAMLGIGLVAYISFYMMLGILNFVLIGGNIADLKVDLDKQKPAVSQNEENKAEEKPVEEAKPTDEQREKLKQFESAMLEKNTRVMESFGNISEVITGFSNGNYDILTVYNGAKQHKNFVIGLGEEVSKTKVPEGLPEDVQQLLMDSKAELTKGLTYQNMAFDALLDYLDSRKVSKLADYEKYSPVIILQAKKSLEKIVEAKSLLEK